MSLRSSSLRSALTRLAIVTAAGALAAGAAVTPAVADDGWGGSDSSHGRYDDGQQVGGDRGDHGRDNPRRYKGRITANGGLTLRSAPNRGARIIRVARQGEIVSIYCKTSGDNVQGNRLWYLLTDGTWAWGAAYYIDNIGPAPRWC